jgi:transcriptional regulator with XRE-family HTH domain
VLLPVSFVATNIPHQSHGYPIGVPRRSTPDPLAVVVGARVRALRTAKGWNLEKLAWAGGLSSKGHLSDLENGRLVPTIATLHAIAEQLGVELVDLLLNPSESLRHRVMAATALVPPAQLARWLAEAEHGTPARAPAQGAVVEVVLARRAPRNAVPFVDLAAAAGTIGSGRSVTSDAWVKADAKSRQLPGVFAARVDGDAMEPLVPAGSVGLFRRPAPGNRTGRVFLVQHRGPGAPDDGGASLLKLIERDPRSEAHIILRSLNPAHPPLRIDARRHCVEIVAEFVRVLGRTA